MINQMLIAVGPPGFIALVIVLQLSAAGGTPIETARVFTAPHSWLPITHSVDGLRSLVLVAHLIRRVLYRIAALCYRATGLVAVVIVVSIKPIAPRRNVRTTTRVRRKA